MPIRRTRDIQSTSSAFASSGARTKPSLRVANDDADDHNGVRRVVVSQEERGSRTFGQRAREALLESNSTSAAGKKRGREGESEGDIVKGTPLGGMEMSFIPAVVSKDEEKKQKKVDKLKEKKEKSSFGSGLEKSGDAREDEREVEGEEAEGRKKMRKGVRSASRNVTRGL